MNFLRYPARLLVELLVTNTSCLPCGAQQEREQAVARWVGG